MSIVKQPTIRDTKLEFKQGSNSNIWIILVLLLIAALFVGYIILSVNSSIVGTEFNPVTFQNRSFAYSRLPYTKVRLSQTKLGTPSSSAPIDVLKHLPAAANSSWHVILINELAPEKFSASILEDALKERNADGHSYWGAWSMKNPKEAQVLWPIVQQMACQELYSTVPALLETAESNVETAKLREQLLMIVADRIVTECSQANAVSSDRKEFYMSWLTKLPGGEDSEAIHRAQVTLERLP